MPGDLADLAELVARFGARLAAAGLPVGPERLARFAHAIALVDPVGTPELYRCARATLLSEPGQEFLLASVFHAVFGGSGGGASDPADARGDPGGPPAVHAPARQVGPAGSVAVAQEVPADRPVPPDGSREAPATATAVERLAVRDFAELTQAELLSLAELMRRLTLATPLRPARRFRAGGG